LVLPGYLDDPSPFGLVQRLARDTEEVTQAWEATAAAEAARAEWCAMDVHAQEAVVTKEKALASIKEVEDRVAATMMEAHA
jgi:hypothetical protein